jgi:phenylalanyl-tRNA synthetase beta chain
LHPQWLQKYDLPLAPVVFELDLDPVKLAKLPNFVEVSRQPSATRDLAIVVDQKLELQQLIDGMLANRPSIIKDIRLFDVYTGKGIASGEKSLAFRIVMQDTQRTLQEAEVESAMQELTTYLQKTFAAQLRV